MKQLDTSIKQYNLRNWKETTKRLCTWIDINKILGNMNLRAKKRLGSRLRINKMHGVVMLVSMNELNNSALQT